MSQHLNTLSAFCQQSSGDYQTSEAKSVAVQTKVKLGKSQHEE